MKSSLKARLRNKRSRRGGLGGNMLASQLHRAAVPFGLFALSKYLGQPKSYKKSKKSKGTRKGDRRKTARRAYMKKK